MKLSLEHYFARLTSVRHGKKPQDVEQPFGIIVIIARVNCTHVIRLETEVQEVKKG